MHRRTTFLAAALMAVLLTSCAAAPGRAGQWWIRVTGTGGAAEGSVRVQLTDEPLTGGACVSRSSLKKARVLEKHGFDSDPLRDVVGMEIADGRFFAELTPGICDASLTLEGPVEGDRASGPVTRSTIAGPRPAGTFTAERIR